ncbi:hypothetical protein LCGC14_1781040 [marine sediment metagenome]|uniref:Uncharacterized protein n=1 Tax=marine sediment metagenome TaxID=412755 RepID=A0A0F9GVE2_9ZZZZ
MKQNRHPRTDDGSSTDHPRFPDRQIFNPSASVDTFRYEIGLRRRIDGCLPYTYYPLFI